MEPRELAERAEAGRPDSSLPFETFRGWGIMGLPFKSGHVLALRRFPASSVGPGYSSVWHRDPQGAWTFYSNVEPLQSCNRYFGMAVERFVPAAIEIAWPGPRSLAVRMPGQSFSWDLELAPTPVTRAMNVMSSMLPESLWHSARFLAVMGPVAGPALGAGRIRLQGRAPNGQTFLANPRLTWVVASSRAQMDEVDFGEPGALPEQASLGDFMIPQRGMFAAGGTFFEPFDPGRHLSCATRGARDT